jgi:hypothetical protein
MSKEQEVKHTELPWIISTDGNHIAHRDKTGVAIFIKPEDGRFAVTACNSHYALKKENGELRATVGEVDVTELKLQEYADNYVAQYLPHVDTTGHWLGFQDGYKKAIQDIKISLITAGITV